MVFSKDGHLLEADDGGLYRRVNDIPTVPIQGRWMSLNGDSATGNLQISEVHSADWDANRNTILAGTQDNGTARQVSPSERNWQEIQNGDGGNVAIDDRAIGRRSTTTARNT